MRSAARLPLLLAAIACVALAGVAAYDLYRERNLAIQQVRGETANLARLLEAHSRSNLLRVEVVLNDAVARLKGLPREVRPGHVELREQLVTLVAVDRLVQGLAVIDAYGAVLLSTLSGDARLGDGIANRDWFAGQRRGDVRGLAIGALEKSRGGKWILPVSKRVDSEDGEFAGVVVAAVDIATIQPVLDAVDTGANGFVTIFLSQGWLIATAPANEALFARRWDDSPMFKEHLPRSAVDTVQQVVVRDNTERVYSYRALADYPVVISIGKSLTDALADWRERLWWNVVLLLATSAALMAAAAGLTRHYERREAAERALAQAAQETRAIVDHAADGIVTFDSQGKVESVNLAGEAIFGLPAKDLIGRDVSMLVPELVGPQWRTAESGPEIAELPADSRIEGIARRGDGSMLPIEISVTAVERDRKRVFVGLVRDITDSKRVQAVIAQARDRAEQSERFLREITDNVPLRIAYVDRDLRYRFVNNAHCERYGLPREQIIGRTRQELTHDSTSATVFAEVQAVLKGESRRFEFEEVIGERRMVVESFVVPDPAPDGTVRGFYSAIADVTERHQQRTRLEVALAERETLLREVYHRVKNNLQMVQSLLNLQRRVLPEGAGRAALDDSVERVRAMALVHEKLYQHGTLSAVDLPEYTRDLLVQIAESAGAHRRGIALHADVDAVQAPLDVSVPYGLLVSELVGNALKHGFADGRSGEIRVVIKRDADGIRLRVQDNGVGLPKDFDVRQPQSMGLQIASSLAEQLGGTLEACHESGAVFTVALPRLA